MPAPAARRSVGRPGRLVVVLGALTAFGPLTMDLYLPGLPDLAEDLGTGVADVQVTVTACVLGLAFGQVLAGPIGDTFGRRRPLLIGLALFTLASVGCALASSIGMLNALRVVQGLAGATGITLARAMVRDSFEGAEVARMYSSLAAVVSVAPIVAPLVGALLLAVGNWRFLFLFLAVVGAVLLIVSAAWTAETLPRARRRSGHPADILRTYRDLLRDRGYLSYTVPLAMSAVLMFGFLTASSFVYQDVYGVSPQVYGLLFGVNGCVLMASNIVNKRLVGRVPQRRLLEVGLVWIAGGGSVLAIAGIAGAGAMVVIPLVSVACCGLGMVNPNATALALTEQKERAGSAAGLMGLLQFAAGAIVPPVLGAIGTSPATMGGVMATGGVLALASFAVLSIRREGAPASAAS
ncbi:multidrug effflux MFS transporter [Conexibacter sp. CPCC 206217]|uniref:multidrug effflux MFS transporter n=1 Tax=Conexibacter sp. CPCC 206217 TaxID=3064574 RepID=UPI0027197D3A|nr:multidrug effflux MFS transporter [Conexibacter sp. CPCC 206217]MDO8213173.1 multidrug effflux MFS transporter [Conexibacter sp. CPCC 206217]